MQWQNRTATLAPAVAALAAFLLLPTWAPLQAATTSKPAATAARPAAPGAIIVPVGPEQLRTTLDEHRGKVVLVNFWATWCRPCLKELPDLMALEARYRDRGFVLLAVSLDDPADREAVVRPFIDKWFPTLHTLARLSPDMDSMVSVIDHAWNEVLPTSYILDRNGKIQARMQGGKAAAVFEAAILPLLEK